ncbi:MAG: hypothetical protein ABJB74_12715 [Gemmatimonas sp.]
MTEYRPPFILESLLEALGAQSTFRDAVMGDLAEEYAVRVQRDGRFPALRWYTQQAARTAPHLLGSWSRQKGIVRQVARVVSVSYVAATIALVVALFIVIAVMNVAGVSQNAVERAFLDVHPRVVLGVLLLQSVSPLCGGFIAARLDRRSPLVSVFTCGVVWSVAFLLSSAFIPFAVKPEWWRFATFGIVLLGTWMSGLVGLWSTSSARARSKP